MGFGTLGDPDITITDTETQMTATGGVTFADDGKGGQHAISNGAGGRVATIGDMMSSDSSQQVTFAFLYNYLPVGVAYLFRPIGGNKPQECFFDGAGKYASAVFSSTGTLQIGSQGIARDTSTTFLCVVTFDIRSSTTGDYDHDIYTGELGGAMEKLSTASVTSMGSPLTPYGNMHFLADDGGSFPSANGSTFGQLRVWQDKSPTDADVDIINAEYDSGNFGAGNGDTKDVGGPIDLVTAPIYIQNGIVGKIFNI